MLCSFRYRFLSDLEPNKSVNVFGANNALPTCIISQCLTGAESHAANFFVEPVEGTDKIENVSSVDDRDHLENRKCRWQLQFRKLIAKESKTVVATMAFCDEDWVHCRLEV